MSDLFKYSLPQLKLSGEELLVNETIFHNANGYIGVRSNFEESYPEGYDTIRGTYINGFYDYAGMNQAERLHGLCERKQTMLNVADTQGIVLYIGGERFSMFEGEVKEASRTLDMKAGTTQRHVVWRSEGGKEVEINIRRMTSFTHKSLFLTEYRVKALNFSGRVDFESSHIGDVKNYCNPNDPRVAGESFEHLIPRKANFAGDISIIKTGTSASNLLVVSVVKNLLSKDCDVERTISGHRCMVNLETDMSEGEEIVLYKYSVFADSVRCANPEGKAIEELERVLAIPVNDLYREQEDYMDNFFATADLDIEGDDDLSIAIKYNMFELLQSVGKDEFSNIAAKGLSGEGYEGHYFWDTEMYMQPFFTLTNPELSKNLIAYRHKTLDKARENARILGHNKGALYPWRTIEGSECSGYFPSGSAQYHIDGDIAYSVIAYYLATGDFEFIANKGAEIVFETARLWMDAGNATDKGFMINGVTGPDEYTCMVNNNYFTNASAQYNLHWAVNFFRMLKEAGKPEWDVIERIGLTEAEVAEFEQAEKSMFLPYDEKLGINPQDDSFLQKKVWDFENTPKENYPLLLYYHPLYIYRFQVCKQADTVLAHFIYEDAQDLKTIERSFEYYEKITTHDSSLSTCIYSIVAAKLGQVDKAYRYFGDSAKLDLFNLHGNTKDGIHTANMGGNYMAIVYGFGGLRLKESGLYLAPCIPTQWKSYHFKIQYRGSRILVEVDHAQVKVSLQSGEPVEIVLFGDKVTLKDAITVSKDK